MEDLEIAGPSSKANPDIIVGNLPTEIRNSYWNHAAVAAVLDSGQAKDVSRAPKVRAGPLLVLGSGPSLDDVLPILKSWEGDVMCSQSHAVTCVGWGKEPTYVVAYDVRAGWGQVSPHPEGAFDNTALITHPGIGIDLIPRWPSEIYLFQNLSLYTKYNEEEQVMGYSYPGDNTRMIQSQLRSFGSSASAMVSFANMMGYRPIFLCGVDFGYPGGKKRFTKRIWEGEEWVDVDSPEAKSVGEIDGCPTDRVQAMYKRAFIQAWRTDKAPLIDCSRGILGDLFPKASIVDVITQQGKGFKPLTWKQCILRADAYLVKQNHYAIETTDGSVFFVEQESLEELEKNLGVMKKRGVPIDIRKNMRRYR